ncbi:related to lactonohydrolase [Rhynchosporium agropyri]|uniref:Related to lactonohydrolase n=1 Tax=Rhynchosporium agropyri TaxID=914238 RepID=A0A1E1L7N9_9HELO|nr:related to lactonohydrolase [Rhynchosporium agropyri]
MSYSMPISRTGILQIPTKVKLRNRSDKFKGKSSAPSTIDPTNGEITILQYSHAFADLIGPQPSHSVLLSETTTPKERFSYTACVFLPQHDEIFMTTTLIPSDFSLQAPKVYTFAIELERTDPVNGDNHIRTTHWRKTPWAQMYTGLVNYEDGVLICARANEGPGTGGIYYMPRWNFPQGLVTNHQGRALTSVNDVVVAKKDGCFWFTDPDFGFEMHPNQRPDLPCHVFRFDFEKNELRIMVNCLNKPSGLAFSPDESVLYVMDTDCPQGDESFDRPKATEIYAFDITEGPFLANQRLFAYAAGGGPSGIKCDVSGNVYAGCGVGIGVWDPEGVLIGRFLVPGGVKDFTFGKNGELFICSENTLRRVQLGEGTKGALLGI